MSLTEKEIWRPVKNYEGLYEVSNFGRVRSLTRKVKTSKRYHSSRIEIEVRDLNE